MHYDLALIITVLALVFLAYLFTLGVPQDAWYAIARTNPGHRFKAFRDRQKSRNDEDFEDQDI